jgi:hypothetical protein
MFRSLCIQGLTILVQIVVVVVGGYAIGFLHKALAHAEAKTGKEKLEFYRSTAKTIALAVEQQFPDLKGENKYIIAAEMLNKKLGSKLSDDEIKQLIEAAVAEINLIKKPTNQSTTVINNSSDAINADAEETNPTAENSTPEANTQPASAETADTGATAQTSTAQ